MKKTIVALYDDFNSAGSVVRELVDHGFNRDDISLMSADSAGEYTRELGDQTKGSATGMGVGVGALVGGLGGLVIGLGVLAIPGIGPVLAAGPLAGALSALAGAGVGAAAGGIAGGLIGALVDMGIPEETAPYYAEGVRRGGTLVTLNTTDDRIEQGERIMNRYNPVNIDERVDTWRESGWTGYDPNAEPYRVNTEGRQRVVNTDLDYQGFDYYEPGFRSHFDSSVYHNTYPYDQFRPAYLYGYDLATQPASRNMRWEELEPEAQFYWENKEPGAWERFKDSVRYAWQEIKQTVK